MSASVLVIMGGIVLFLAMAGALNGAIVRGVVLEERTGKPLARSLVSLQPIEGTPTAPITLRTNTSGGFDSPPIPAGAYLVTASRPGFVPWKYGQKNFRSAGTPIFLDDAGATFLDIRLRRYGAITGTVIDDSGIGLPEHEVVAFRNTRPPKLASLRVKTDERGYFRIFGLAPGSYLVRTVGAHYEEGDYLPTFSREAESMEQAQTAEVMLDEEVNNLDVKPPTGKLIDISGVIKVPYDPRRPAPMVDFTLATEMGRYSMRMPADSATFNFPKLAPGRFELYAQAPCSAPYPICSAYQEFKAEKDTEIALQLTGHYTTQIRFFAGSQQVSDIRNVKLMMRRKDIAGEGEPSELKMTNGYNASAMLGMGTWEFMVLPNATYSVVGMSGPRGVGKYRQGWNEAQITGSGPGIAFQLSKTPAEIRGAVKDEAHKPVIGAPVFLEPYDPVTRTRLTEPRMTRTDLQGNYSFGGLSPGHYRLLSTFEYELPDSEALDLARADDKDVRDGQHLQFDLDLYVIR